MKPKITSRTQVMFALIWGSGLILVIILLMNRDYPWVGHDYAYFIPRLIDTELHIRINGFTIQWYTPSFGGGLPGFPNPQHIEYSLVQLISLIVNPWTAVVVSTAIISMGGYYFFYMFLNRNLELHWMASALGAMFFIGNGFYIEHLIAGQMGYQLFPLFGAILYAITDKHNPCLYNAAVVAIVLSLMIHQAGFYLIVILILSTSITLPLLSLYKYQMLNLHNLGWLIASAFILTIPITGSKVYAVYEFMSHFPREVVDRYEISILQAFQGMLAQLLGVMVLEPLLILTGHIPDFLSGALSRMTGTRAGIWETDTGLSPILVILLLRELALAIVRIRRSLKPAWNHQVFLTSTLLALSIWVTAEMTLARGFIYTISKQLPFFKSLHVNIRFISAFILPLIIIGVFPLHRFFQRNPKLSYFSVLAFLTIASLLSFFFLSSDVHLREFNVTRSNVLHEKIQDGNRFPISKIVDIVSEVGFLEYASSYQPYEPIFGYFLEEFKPEIHKGNIFEEQEGYFNMTNPASLVFPDINNLYPFERFKSSERDKLVTFLERRQPEWKFPIAQKILNTVSIIALMFSIGILCTTKITTRISADKQKNAL